MTAYLLLALSPVIIGAIGKILFENDENKYRKFLVILTGCAMFFMIAFRYKGVGTIDSSTYYRSWYVLGNMNFNDFLYHIKESRLEKGYLISTWALSHIPMFSDPQFTFVFSGAFITIFVCRFLNKYCKNLVIGFTMFISLGLYTFMVQGLRQALAMSICLFAIDFIKQRKIIKFIIVVLIAMLFHQTAIVFLFAYFIYNFKTDFKTLAVFSICLGIIVVSCSGLINAANNLFNMDYADTVESGGYIAVSIYIITLIMALIFKHKSTETENQDDNFFFYLTYLGMGIYLMRYFGALAAERISFYFMFGQIILLPSAFKNYKGKLKPMMFACIIALSIGLFAYRLNTSNLVPFYFFWQK